MPGALVFGPFPFRTYIALLRAVFPALIFFRSVEFDTFHNNRFSGVERIGNHLIVPFSPQLLAIVLDGDSMSFGLHIGKEYL